MATPLILADTSIFIEYLRKQKKDRSILYQLTTRYRLATSVITVYELFTGAISPAHEQRVHDILFAVEILSLDKSAAEIAARERLRLLELNRQFEIRDILIAGTAMRHNLALATLNVKHFQDFDLELVELPRKKITCPESNTI